MKPLKMNELRPCDSCSGPIAPLFYRVKVERTGILLRDVQREMGLAQYLGGNLQLAQVMGTNPDTTKAIESPVEIFLCANCACQQNSLAMFVEQRVERLEKKT